MIVESTFSFGSPKALAATLTHPETSGGNRIGVLLINAGVIGRAGPNRLNVKLARRAAQMGLPAMRVDLTGLGDSDASTCGLTYAEQGLRDIRDAMDEFSRRAGVDRFVMIGFCSGAEHGLRLATVEERVCGLMMVDPPANPDRWWALRRAVARARRLGPKAAWARLLALRNVRDAIRYASVEQHMPSKTEYAATLARLVDRGVDLFMVYTNGSLEAGDYRSQFSGDPGMVAVSRRIRRAFLSGVDHTVTDVEAQQQLLQGFSEWAARLDAASPRGATSTAGAPRPSSTVVPLGASIS